MDLKTPLYDKLKQQKTDGILKPWDDVTVEELRELFIEESLPDVLIGDLWDIDKKEVQTKRYKNNIKTSTMKSREYLSGLFGLTGNVIIQQLTNKAMEYSRDPEKEHLIAGLEHAAELIRLQIQELEKSNDR